MAKLFSSKWLNFFSQCNERKNWLILTLKVESLAELKFDKTFYVKMTQFLLSVHREKKLSHFDPKSWVIGRNKIRPSKVSNWRIFESIRLSMFSQFGSQCWVNLTLIIESIKPFKAGVHLRCESEINVESWGLSSVHTPESSLDICQRAFLTVVDTVHPDVWDYCTISSPRIAYSGRAERKMNVESCFLACGHATESTLWHSWGLCLRASLT